MLDKELLRKYKVDLENESYIAEAVYEKILTNYMESIDEVVNEVESIIKDIENGNIDSYSNEDLEKVVIKIPMLMYKIGGDIERIGVRIDVVGASKLNKHNVTLLESEGTVAERKAIAEGSVIYDGILENVYKRVYKQIDRKLDYIDSLYNSIKKVMSLRIKELEVFRRENALNSRIMEEEEE